MRDREKGKEESREKGREQEGKRETEEREGNNLGRLDVWSKVNTGVKKPTKMINNEFQLKVGIRQWFFSAVKIWPRFQHVKQTKAGMFWLKWVMIIQNLAFLVIDATKHFVQAYFKHKISIYSLFKSIFSFKRELNALNLWFSNL